MTPLEQDYYVIKGMVASLPEEQRELVATATEAIRNIVKEAGEFGVAALAMIGAEYASRE